MLIPDLAEKLNDAAGNFEVGRLQELRVRLRGLSRAPSRGIFNALTVHEDYAFHVGGRSELQFNIGVEERNGLEVIRHGVAFSLEPSQTLPTIDPLVPKIERFNDYIRSYLEDFPGFRMWHHDDQGRSEEGPVAPIHDHLVVAGTFIVLGRTVPSDQVDVSSILADFDRLLPLYAFVEAGEEEPASQGDWSFQPGCPEFAKSTTARLTGRTVDVALRHNNMELKLYELLCDEAGRENVGLEHPLDLSVRVDAVVRENGGFTFYEVKAARTVKSCLRAALGQLLEYAYWPSADRASELIIVGEGAMDPDSAQYLQLLRDRFALPVWYRRIDVEGGVLEAKDGGGSFQQ